jgi:hypothetical protein
MDEKGNYISQTLSSFKFLVDYLQTMIDQARFTPTEMNAAVTLTAIQSSFPKGVMFYGAM